MKKGSVALTTVILVSGILLTIGVTIILIGKDLAKSSRSYFNYVQAEINSTTCLEEGLERVKKNLSIEDTFTIPLQEGSCTVIISNDTNPGIKKFEITSEYQENSYGIIKKVDTSKNPFEIFE